jgi:hypothetical protein
MATSTSSPTTITTQVDEQLRRVAQVPTARQLIAAGVKRGNSPFTVQSVNA